MKEGLAGAWPWETYSVDCCFATVSPSQSLILISIKALLILRSLISGLSTALPVEVSLLIRMSRLQFPCALRLMHPGNM